MNLNIVHEIQPCCPHNGIKSSLNSNYTFTHFSFQGQCRYDTGQRIHFSNISGKKSCQIADALKCKHNFRKILISLCDAILNQTHARAMVRAHTLDVRRTHARPTALHINRVGIFVMLLILSHVRTIHNQLLVVFHSVKFNHHFRTSFCILPKN